MRIISQNGITDIPYDLYGVRQLKSDLSKIIAFTNGDEFLIMAEYSTEAKAKKAMEMLRNEYMQYATAKSEDYWFAFDYPKVFNSPLMKMWRFSPWRD